MNIAPNEDMKKNLELLDLWVTPNYFHYNHRLHIMNIIYTVGTQVYLQDPPVYTIQKPYYFDPLIRPDDGKDRLDMEFEEYSISICDIRSLVEDPALDYGFEILQQHFPLQIQEDTCVTLSTISIPWLNSWKDDSEQLQLFATSRE